MPIDVAKITAGRKQERAEAGNTGDARTNLELQYIADALEAIRGEIVGLAHFLSAIATKKP
jgi:hypothetical protein